MLTTGFQAIVNQFDAVSDLPWLSVGSVQSPITPLPCYAHNTIQIHDRWDGDGAPAGKVVRPL